MNIMHIMHTCSKVGLWTHIGGWQSNRSSGFIYLGIQDAWGVLDHHTTDAFWSTSDCVSQVDQMGIFKDRYLDWIAFEVTNLLKSSRFWPALFQASPLIPNRFLQCTSIYCVYLSYPLTFLGRHRRERGWLVINHHDVPHLALSEKEDFWHLSILRKQTV